jgi:Leucine-rich repeat (LRR) protein
MFGPFNEKEVFAKLSDLQILELGGNFYNTSIPSEIAKLPKLYNLYVDNSFITGDLSFMTSMQEIWELWIDNNPTLLGPIPTKIGMMTSLESLSMAKCNLFGAMPSELGLLTGMQQMWLQENALTGTIPTELVNLINLHTFHIEGNDIQGLMPIEICSKNFTELVADCSLELECPCCTCCGLSCVNGGESSETGEYVEDMTLSDLIHSIALKGGDEFENPNSPQSKALLWLVADTRSDRGERAASTGEKLAANPVNIIQRYSLAVIYFSTYAVRTKRTPNGNTPLGWKETNKWLSKANECTWKGVHCTERGKVIGLSLESNRLSGTIPMEIIYLRDSLNYFDVSNNELADQDEDLRWMIELTKLTYLDLHNNFISYKGIPKYIEELVDLNYLDISGNHFDGEIDGSIFSNTKKLTHLSLSRNSFSSSVPDAITSLPALKFFFAESANIIDDVSFLIKMPQVSGVKLGHNPDLRGTIPRLIERMTSLEILSMPNCGLKGTLPKEFRNLTNLKEINLANNSLTGVIPSDLASLSQMQILKIEGNDLQGTMPLKLCYLRNKKLSTLGSDCSLPKTKVICECCTCCASPCIKVKANGTVHGLERILNDAMIDISENDHVNRAFHWLEQNSNIHTYSISRIIQRFALATVFISTNGVASNYTLVQYGSDETVPSWKEAKGWLSDDSECTWYGLACTDKKIEYIKLSNNGLSGIFPNQIALLADNLKGLEIGDNIVGGSFEELDWMSKITNLVELDVHSCNFVFPGVPTGLRALTNLKKLDISYCIFSGSLDSDIFTGMTSLRYLDISGNSFHSPISKEFPVLPYVEYFYAEFTDLIGDLSFLEKATSLIEFWADYNPKLSGSIPKAVHELSNLRSISISNSALTGSIPSELGHLSRLEQIWLNGNALQGTIPTDLSSLTLMKTIHLEENNLTGNMPTKMCGLRDSNLASLSVDCAVPKSEVRCICCTCCSSPCLTEEDRTPLVNIFHAAEIDFAIGYKNQAFNWLMDTNAMDGYSNEKILQRFILVCFYLATNEVVNAFTDPTITPWNNQDGWLTESDECSWFGIQCDENGDVVAIRLDNNNLSGSLPAEIERLQKSLLLLDISGNAVHNEGDDLRWMRNLTKLTHLNLHLNYFHANGVPDIFPATLRTLDISYTLMAGDLNGAAFKMLENLEYLQMGGNDYESNMPSELYLLPNLKYLYAQNAGLKGDLSFIPKMVSPIDVWIDLNPEINGSIPTLIGQATSLKSLSISGCGLTGSIPTEMGLLTRIHEIWLFDNKIEGIIPSELGMIQSIKTFQTQGNHLSGRVPDEICALRSTDQGVLDSLTTDCLEPSPEVDCACCTCCKQTCYGNTKVNPKTILESRGLSHKEHYQTSAFQWLENDPRLQSYPDWKVVQRYSLACIYFATNTAYNSRLNDKFDKNMKEIPSWKREERWLTSNNECDWFGVKCLDGIVNTISLPANGLSGSVPPEIKLLDLGLTYLDLSENKISSEGEGLSWMSALTMLTHLDFHQCNFFHSGVPLYMASLSRLEYLDLSYTLLSGEIQGTIFSPMSNLTYLSMGGISFNGAIPTEIITLPQLKYFYIESADLIDNISFVVDFVAIKEIWLDNNPNLIGTIPDAIGSLTTLISLSISGCGITGTIPQSLGMLTGMNQLWLYNNSLTGPIPEELSSLSELRTLHVENNNLQGAMPSSICKLRDTFGGYLSSLASDCLVAPEPAIECLCCTCCMKECFGNNVERSATKSLDAAGINHSSEYAKRAIEWLDSQSDVIQTYGSDDKLYQRFAIACIYFATNGVSTAFTESAFSGLTTPTWDETTSWLSIADECSWFGIGCEDGKVSMIDLRKNKLTGYFPKEIELLAGSLKHLDISGNIVASSDENLSWISSLSKLTYLDVSYCRFEYIGIPPFIANLTALETLHIGHTLFYGELKGSIFKNLKYLKDLSMGGNVYRSSLPTEISTLPSLERIYVENSFLTGDVTIIIETFGQNLFELWADDNPGLIGTIPRSIGKLTNVASLSFTNCGISGTLPTELGHLTSLKQLWLVNNTLTGTIPTELARLTSLEVLQTEENQFIGTMPNAICDLRDVFGGSLGFLSADCSQSDYGIFCDCCNCCESPCSP